MEAADLGIRLCQASWRSAYSCYFLAAIPIVALCLATFEIATWLPTVLLWIAKPWLDRSILFALARSAFGQQTSWRDLWREKRTVWGRHLVRSWTIRRLSPWRSLTQPVHQLEGLTGSALRKRIRQVRVGKTGSAILMTSALSFVEFAFMLALMSFAFWFAPQGQAPAFFELFSNESSNGYFEFMTAAMYAVTILFLEPFYVGAGFGMYLSRRVELEAWDIEQELRRAFA
jgi:hypothetical protein